MVRQSERFVPIKLNAEKEGTAQTKQFAVQGYPTILFLTPDEKVAWKIVGYLPPSGFLGEMKKAENAYVNGPKWEKALAANPNDVEALFGIIPLLVQQEKGAQAEAMLTRLERLAPKDVRMADAYNAIGDAHQNANEPDKAIPFFEKAARSRDESKVAYALMSIAYCEQMRGKPKEAVPYLERLLKMGKAADEYRDQAKAMLASAKKG